MVLFLLLFLGGTIVNPCLGVYDQNFDSSEKWILESQLTGLFAQLHAVADHLRIMHIIRMLVLGGSTQCITIYLEAALTLGWLGSDHRYGLSSVGCPEAKEGLAGWRSVARKYYNSNLQVSPQ